MSPLRRLLDAIGPPVASRKAFRFEGADMEGMVWEAIAAAFDCGERAKDDGTAQDQSFDIADALLTKVRNYAITGNPNGGG